MPQLRVAIAQSNPVVGDISGNLERLMGFAERAWDAGAEVMLTGELALSGYPIEDLALRDDFLHRCREAVDRFAADLEARGLGDLVVVLGHPDGPFPPPSDQYNPAHPQQAHNSASVIQHGRVTGRYNKHHLPNYSVFDEFRTFLPGTGYLVVRVGDVDCGIVICEDLWREHGPVATMAALPLGALLVPNASPFERDKDDVRLPLVKKRAQQMNCAVVYTNLVGGQDDLVFDGDSVAVDRDGSVLTRLPVFDEDLQVVTIDAPDTHGFDLPETCELVVVDKLHKEGTTAHAPVISEEKDDLELVWQALVTGTRDYVNKNGFPAVIWASLAESTQRSAR
jgi:NAD+ synthase (glutamine-hydrolysing)